MAIWPFRRKSRRKGVRASTTDFEDARGRAVEQTLAPRRSHTEDITMVDAGFEPEQTLHKQRPEVNKLQRKQRSYSFSPGRNDAIFPGRRSSVRGKQNTRASTGLGFNAAGDEIRRAPTLHNKRDGDHLPRKKSSKKRRKDNQQREAEIKAMSNFIPQRAATEDWTSSHLLRRHSKRTRTGTGMGFAGFMGSSRKEWDRYNRSSDMSTPAESIHSNFSSDSEHISFKVSVLEKLAPRPTLQYAMHSRPVPDGDSNRLARAPSRQQRKLSAPIPEATLKAHKRIHDLADDLSAGDLRELMERDKRRRERRRQREQEKLELKLARRAEKQREDVAQAEREGRDSPPNLERGVLGREAEVLGTDPTSAVITSSRIRQSPERHDQKDKHREHHDESIERADARPDPLASFHRTSSIPLQSPKLVETQTARTESNEPVLASPRSKSSFMRLRLARSKSPNDSDVKTDHSDPPESGSSRSALAWASFFRWGNKAKRSSAGPSSFSNTSRDSMTGQQLPVQTPPANFIPRRLSSGVPKRTMSRFREDLPELSTPNPQHHRPDPTPEPIVEASPDPEAVPERALFTPSAPWERNDTPTSEQRQTPSIFGHPDEPSVSPEVHTLSLASIDSEASWLSGRLHKKKRHPSGSLGASPYGPRPRGASESDTEGPQEQGTPNEDVSITEDEYLARVTHSASDRQGWNRKSTGEPRPSSDGEEETHWGTVRGHQPKLVQSHAAGRIKSREVLLKSFGEEGEMDISAGPSGSGTADRLQRATSVNLGKGHARQISAGSARLLSISPRSSVDATRLSMPPKQPKTSDT